MPEVRELPLEKVYDTNLVPVLLRGRVNVSDGHGVLDFQLTFGSWDTDPGPCTRRA